MWTVRFAVLVMLSVLLVTSTGLTQPRDVCPSLTVVADVPQRIGGPAVKIVQVSLFKDGKLVKTTELVDTKWTVEWKNVEQGRYEVHFEGKGMTRIVRNIVLEHEAQKVTGVYEEGVGTKVIGGGPYLKQLEDRITRLEETLRKAEKK